ncbi:hypothetical protein HPE56_05885 [Maribacter sp. ANRC-HE7]|uniref:Secreted protein n=1 Tax=Maribacter aquimaris TaxID=2737171 RepID=A0ABR7V2B8_9FLAO|nr:hypothetical protein [Maribacter aquimaris]MBD0777317.1 hypothetical protein [Maribacter aquimaris]
MKRIFHKISSFLMAIVVLFSTMSFTVDMHYCGDTLMDSAIFYKAENCGMVMEKSTSNSDCNITINDCCSGEQIVIDGQDELKISFDTLTFDQQLFVASFVYTYINLFEGLEENVTSYRDYAPPLVFRQIYKLDETYLI